MENISSWQNVFQNCNKLIKIEFPENLKFFNDSMFENCISLKQISIPNSIKVIPINLFYNCLPQRILKILF